MCPWPASIGTDPGSLSPRLAEKQRVARQRGARFAAAAFFTGALDPFSNRANALGAVRLPRGPIARLRRDQALDAARARLSEARPSDGLKAAEMLAKMCGWNEAEKGEVRHIHLQVDAGLIEQLRAGYAEMSATRMGEPKQLAISVAANSEANRNP
jgi:hypothetical protein